MKESDHREDPFGKRLPMFEPRRPLPTAPQPEFETQLTDRSTRRREGFVLERQHTLSSMLIGHNSNGNPQFDTKRANWANWSTG